MEWIEGKLEFTEGEKKFNELNLKIMGEIKHPIYNRGEFKSPIRSMENNELQQVSPEEAIRYDMENSVAPVEDKYAMKRTPIKRKPKTREQIQEQKDETEKMWTLFREIWNERPHKSEVSGEFLGYEPRTIYFHHILPKSKYPEYKYIKENVILLTWEEHSRVENDIYRYEEVNKRRENLINLLSP
jgi:hypothetical protein